MNGLSRTRIKICGMTRLADARCAVEAGVDALGFIFYPRSPRALTPEAARVIVAELPPFVGAVGVFVDEDLTRVAEIVAACRLGYVQLHGAESPDYCRQLRALAPCCQILKAIRVGAQTTAAEVISHRDCVQGYLLDTYQKNSPGGTGMPFDWALVDRLGIDRPYFLAGGLDAGNIHAALDWVRPYGVDANSGLEDVPGQKNHQLIRQFIATVRAVEAGWLAGQE